MVIKMLFVHLRFDLISVDVVVDIIEQEFNDEIVMQLWNNILPCSHDQCMLVCTLIYSIISA